MRILITNNTLARRAGSELFVRDIAIALSARGHQPVAYSGELGEVADEIRARGIPVISDLDSLGAAPDVIHGHHHVETMTALLRFAKVPALYLCHGWTPWEEIGPRHPRIRKYLAVSGLTRERLIAECGVAPQQVSVLANFVDLSRFRPRSPLPARPRRALIFNSRITPSSPLAVAASAACQAEGIELQIAGYDSGLPTDRPEELLARFDVVFAVGRTALEALAVGCAVVTARTRGLGAMVTPANFDDLRRENFGLLATQGIVSAESVLAELRRYDAAGSAEATRRVRSEAGLDAAVSTLCAVYEELIRGDVPDDLIEEMRAASRYVEWVGSRAKLWESARFELDRLRKRIDRTDLALSETAAELAAARRRPMQRLLDGLGRLQRWMFPRTNGSDDGPPRAGSDV